MESSIEKEQWTVVESTVDTCRYIDFTYPNGANCTLASEYLFDNKHTMRFEDGYYITLFNLLGSTLSFSALRGLLQALAKKLTEENKKYLYTHPMNKSMERFFTNAGAGIVPNAFVEELDKEIQLYKVPLESLIQWLDERK